MSNLLVSQCAVGTFFFTIAVHINPEMRFILHKAIMLIVLDTGGNTSSVRTVQIFLSQVHFNLLWICSQGYEIVNMFLL